MAQLPMMRRIARYHIWLGWLVGVPLLMWTISGLVMVARPIEVVRGEHLRLPVSQQALPSETNISVTLPTGKDRPVKSVTTVMSGGIPITSFTYMDGAVERYGPDGNLIHRVTGKDAKRIVAQQIVGGDRVESTVRFDAEDVPIGFRRPISVWQVALEGGTHVYVAQQTGQIAAVRTRWWRIFDFMWGLHIMDLETRGDTSHPILILFTALAALGTTLGCILMFRRRKPKAGPANAG